MLKMMTVGQKLKVGGVGAEVEGGDRVGEQEKLGIEFNASGTPCSNAYKNDLLYLTLRSRPF